MKNLSSNNSLKIITQEVLPPPTCSLVLSSPFHCPSGSYGWQLQCCSVNHQYFTDRYFLPVMGTLYSSVLGMLRFIFLSFLIMAHTMSTAPAHPREVRLTHSQAARASSTTPDWAGPAPQTLCPTEP